MSLLVFYYLCFVCYHFIGLTCTAVCHCFKADACQTVPLQGLSTVS